MTEEAMQGYIDAYVRFKDGYKFSDWWLVSLPSVIVALGLNLSTGSPMWAVFAVLSFLVVGYQAKLELKLHKDKQLSNFTDELEGVNFARDGWSSYLSTIFYTVSLYIYSILGFSALLVFAEINAGLVVIHAALFLAGLLVLPYLTHIPFTLVPYILATNADIGPYEAVKLSYSLMNRDRESKMQIVHAYLLTIVLVVISAFLLFIPLIFVYPYLNFYITDVHVNIMKKHNLLEVNDTEQDSDGLNAHIKVTEADTDVAGVKQEPNESQVSDDDLTVQDLEQDYLTESELEDLAEQDIDDYYKYDTKTEEE